MKYDGRLRMIAIGMAIVMMCLLIASCGKKGNPIPPHMKTAAAMTLPNGDAKGI
jgi:predicted small lipoprotein YifL